MPATACPKCKTALTYEPELAGQVVACPSCGQKLRTPASSTPAAPSRFKSPLPAPPPAPATEPTFPSVATQAAPDPQPMLPTISPAASSKPVFRPREYPALRVIITVLYVFAGLVVAQFLLSVVLMFLGSGRGMPSAFVSDEAAIVGLIGMAIMFAISLVFHGAFVMLFVGSAESIKLWIDIQRNTQEAAYFARLTAG